MSNSRPFLARLPPWISHWLGYRTAAPPKRSLLTICITAFLGSFIGLSILLALFTYSSYFVDRGVPSLIASYGASAVLCYHAIEAPLAQPRALVGGHLISALLGVCINKLFLLLPSSTYASVHWVAAALSTAVAIVAMALTETTHPPAGATALLPALDPVISDLGWYYLAVIALSCILVLVSALLANNMTRRYPVYWVRPAVVHPKAEEKKEKAGGSEAGSGSGSETKGDDVEAR